MAALRTWEAGLAGKSAGGVCLVSTSVMTREGHVVRQDLASEVQISTS